jgi:hypothetical protein
VVALLLNKINARKRRKGTAAISLGWACAICCPVEIVATHYSASIIINNIPKKRVLFFWSLQFVIQLNIKK